ncbi:ScyD/ScyE family protein [Solirubrobacter sp. CPCC 204708]|uniref:ScyD/ScyE family protein n=1 Tax=Solirubrobacter deserti TaxID=2282478 RepID=A0ABT4RD72_9ACTN|nr:ScyD/ScyE family protein [Solirubrobacter deserti]MBE2317744.1 ScyD/ScyE family protein [Solirubrobacter deserti]MDA0136479.1 ScyD/ScyE family protein [Solirubrobacter deserti]
MTIDLRKSLVLAAGVLAIGAAPAAATGPQVIASGLDNPRGLDFGFGGELYVAESGRGGSDCTLENPEGGAGCFGKTGAITKIDKRGNKKRVVSNLPSVASATGGEATGPSDISFTLGGLLGYFTVGLGANPAQREQYPQTAGMGKLYRLLPTGHVAGVAGDPAGYEAAHNPDADQPTAEVDSNPNSVDASGLHVTVADAGGNSLIRYGFRGPETLRVIPFKMSPMPEGLPEIPIPPGTPVPTQSVPTSIVRGPDGAYYVGQLTGFPFPTGGASVWRIVPGQAPTEYATGFTTINDLAFGKDGTLYVLQMTSATLIGPPTPGKLIRVPKRGPRTELAPGTLQSPTGLAVDGHYAYVSNKGDQAGAGEILRIPLR